MATDREEAAFEAGIKLGALYHQWVGTPVSRKNADILERAMEGSVSLQPCVERVRVHLRRELMDPNRFGYTELRGEMFEVQVTTRVRGATCHARLSTVQGYPLMRIERLEP